MTEVGLTLIKAGMDLSVLRGWLEHDGLMAGERVHPVVPPRFPVHDVQPIADSKPTHDPE